MKRTYYFDLLKVISITFVVLIHILGELFYISDIHSLNYHTIVFLNSLCRFCVPVFYMISGALFLNEGKKITIKDIFKKYIMNLLIIFVFWNTSYTVMDLIIQQNNPLTLKLICTSFINSIFGHKVYQLGFLVTIIGFYLCVPILRLITKKENKKELEYFIILTVIYSGIINFLPTIFNINISYPILFSGYISYFILGYYINTFEIKQKVKNIIYFLGILSVFATYLITIYYSNKLSTPYDLFFDYSTIFITLYSSAIFIFFKDKFNKNKESKILNIFKDVYFGIFIIHGFALGLCYKLNLFNLSLPLLPKILLIFGFTYIVSFISSYILTKIPLLKKLIRG